VGDEEDGAGVVLQRLFEQLEGLDVEVVGRLVEHEDVRGREKSRARSSRFRSPPESMRTGELARRGGKRKSPR
jgi:hypothetical protein